MRTARCTFAYIEIIMILCATRIRQRGTVMQHRNETRNNIYYIVGQATRKNCNRRRRRRRYYVWSRGRGRGRTKQIAQLPGRSVLLSARSRRINSFMMTSSIPRDRFVRARARAPPPLHAHTL